MTWSGVLEMYAGFKRGSWERSVRPVLTGAARHPSAVAGGMDGAKEASDSSTSQCIFAAAPGS
jgi:hypothetical protein